MFDKSPKRNLVLLIYTLAITLRIILIVTWGSHSPQIYDAQEYRGLAERLAETGSFIGEDGERVSLRPPLYPSMVAMTFKLFGVNNYIAICVVQAILSVFTMATTHRIASLLSGPWAGAIAATIVGVYPSLLAFNCLLLSETLFTTLLTTAIYFSVKLQGTSKARFAIALGICLGLGALTRSILYVCAPPVLFFLMLTGHGSIKQRFLHTLTAFAFCSAIIAPWSYRNTTIQKTFVIVDVMGGRNVMMGNYEFTPLERSWATVTDVTGERSWGAVLRSTLDPSQMLTQGELDKLAMRYGINFFFTNPTLTAQRCVVRFFNFWQLERSISAGMKQGIWGETSTTLFLAISLVRFTSIIAGYFMWRNKTKHELITIALDCTTLRITHRGIRPLPISPPTNPCIGMLRGDLHQKIPANLK